MARREDGEAPAITVIVPTRDRGDSVLRPLRSVLGGAWRDFELIVVDQSSDERTRDCLATMTDEARVRYHRSSRRGLSHALNEGVAESRSDVIAITGDDCEVATDWLARIVATFEHEPDVGIVFGSVAAGRHDVGRGFVQAYCRDGRFLAADVRSKSGLGGTSACMALRRSAFVRLHGFDALLGVGAPLRAAEETDFAIRALQSGIAILEEPTVRVTHHGFLEWRHLPDLVQRNWYGTGAAFGKLLRRRPIDGAIVLAKLARRWCAPAQGVAATLGERSTRRLRLASFVRGLLAGVRWPIDPRTQHFRGD